MRSNHLNPHAWQARRQRRHGVAMLLVLISLMMATVLTSSYLASRDNSVVIGSNVASAAAARWAADSGLEMGIVILQTEAAWRTSHSSGRLVSGYPVSGGAVDIDLVDIETGLPPTSSTEYVRLTATGTVGGVDQHAIAECRVPVGTGDEMDLDLSEFAVFASQGVSMSDQATIARWPMAPLSELGPRLKMGTRALTASSIALGGESASLDTTVYHGPGASAMLVSVASTRDPEKAPLLDQIPMPAAPASGATAASGSSTAPDMTQSSGNAMTTTNTRWRNLVLSNTAMRMLRGSITVITDEDLRITNGAKLVIDGQVKLVVFGDTRLDAGSIELRPGATLTMHVRGRSGNTFEVRDGFIGELRSNSTRDATGSAPYMNPERLQIFSMAGGDPAATWVVRDNSVVKASMYVPDAASVQLANSSALYGRVASKQVFLRNTAALFYDPALDSRAGYTNPDGAMWESDGTLKSSVKSIASLDGTILQSVADTVGKVVLSLWPSSPNYTPSSGGGSSPTPVPPTDPTPRPVQVETRYLAFGNTLDQWE